MRKSTPTQHFCTLTDILLHLYQIIYNFHYILHQIFVMKENIKTLNTPILPDIVSWLFREIGFTEE